MNSGQKLAVGAGVAIAAVGVLLATRKAGAAPPPPPPPPPPGTGNIYGTVSNSSTGAPISSVAIALDSGQTASVNAQGEYIFQDIPVGTYMMVAVAPGYGDFSQTVNVVSGENTLVMIAMEPAEPPPVGTSFVFVSDPTSASVYINDQLIGITPISSQKYPYGQYTARFSKAGYEDYVVQITSSIQYDTVNVGAILTPIPPPVTPSLTLELDSVERYSVFSWNYPHIIGRVKNLSSQQISGRVVNLFRRYISPSSGLPIVNAQSLGEPLTIYGVPVPESGVYPQFTLSPGGSMEIEFVGWLDLPRDRTCDVWIQDTVTGEISNVMSV